MQTSVISASPGDPIREAARLLDEEDVGSVIVADAQQTPVGIVTEDDVVRLFVEGDAVVVSDPIPETA